MGVCALCGDDLGRAPTLAEDAEALVDHIRVMHPDTYSENPPERWPDGSLVIQDETLTPEEFSE